jgi:hypothetical protein
MGYTIRIGNAKPWHSVDDGELQAGWRVEDVRHEGAPAFGEPTDHTNSRWPSYSAWTETMHTLNLYDLFLNRDNDDALMRRHPGCVLLTADHLSQIEGAVEARRKTNGGRPAGFGDMGDMDCDLARGEWLLYWVRWAVETCETPAIENS